MSTSSFQLRRAADEAWQRANGCETLYVNKANTLRADGTYPSGNELESVRTAMIEAFDIAEELEDRWRASLVQPAPDAHLESAFEDRTFAD